ncbi:hypothetical protein HFN60_30140 [Rhizobium leguminosarum]|uniref:hypothetical protein n=1 Tax=Rhizobium leguminosarum TaxID=384 RepID=UPI001C94A5EB|nr:hypothetical protein [Rhizobium leguminosarum]MBY5819855.1 hypothetical protein [Rhizobium leguminosarum]
MWYLIKANFESYHGWTENEAVKEAAVKWLNRDRDKNFFSAVEVDDIEALSHMTGLLFHGKSRPEDFRH